MPNRRMKHRRVVHKSTVGILKPIPEAVDPVGNLSPGLTTKTVASLRHPVCDIPHSLENPAKFPRVRGYAQS